MKDRPMTLDEARELLAGQVKDAQPWSGAAAICGVCGIPMHIWWSDEQVARHRRYHLAQSMLIGAPS